MTKDKITNLAVQIHYAQSKEVHITIDDWIKKIEALNEPEDKKRIEEIDWEKMWTEGEGMSGIRNAIIMVADKTDELAREINKINNRDGKRN